MAIEIRESFQVRAPIQTVWEFLLDPEKVVPCLPGAELAEIVDARNFLGTVSVKLGAVSSKYKGKIEFTEVDEPNHRVEMTALGKDPSGGTAKGVISSELRPLPDGQTEVLAQATIEITGRVMQVGRGMIQAVSQQLFQQFVASTKARLEADSAGPAAAGAEAGGRGTAAQAPPVAPTPIRLLPILWKTAREAVARFFRRLFGGS
jgi:carbon monoxide dehydrogenase subunit G